jgi:hypothetical protein
MLRIVSVLLHRSPISARPAKWWSPPAGAGGWKLARKWVAPSLAPRTATLIAVGFWLIALTGFVLTALAFWGIVLPVEWWQPIGVASALVSGTGIVLFLGTWATLNTIAALAVNVAVLVAFLIGWPPVSVYLPA